MEVVGNLLIFPQFIHYNLCVSCVCVRVCVFVCVCVCV